MKIRFQSRHGQQSLLIANMSGNPLGRWSNGEVKDVPDDAEVNVQPRPGMALVRMKAVDAILLAGPDFVDDATGKNPDYTCAVCGRETLDQFWVDMTRPEADRRQRYENADGEPLCTRDFLLTQPANGPAWRFHGAVEHSTGYREAVQHVREHREAGTPVLDPNGAEYAPPLEPRTEVPRRAMLAGVAAPLIDASGNVVPVPAEPQPLASAYGAPLSGSEA